MKFLSKRLVAVAAAATLVAGPAFAAGNPAASLSVAPVRAAAPAKHGSKVAGGTATIINIGILAALSAGVLLATTTGGDDSDSN